MTGYLNLRRLVVVAGANSEFRADLLNGNRRQAIAAFGLSDREREVVLDIEAKTLSDFARALLDRIAQQQPVTA